MGIEIKEPCDEDWSRMTSTERGAFCKACAKEVIDFTGMNSIEIKTQLALSYSGNQRVCGRIRNDQLAAINADFYAWKNDQERFKTVWIFSLIAVFGFTLFSCQNTLSKEIVRQMEMNGSEMLKNDASQNELRMVEQEVEVADEEINASVLKEVPLVPMGDVKLDVITESEEFEFLEQTISLGFITYPVELQGDISVTTGVCGPSSEEDAYNLTTFLEPYLPALTVPSPPHLNVNPKPTALQFNQNGVIEPKGDEFEIAIHPLPIVAESRLIIDAHSAIIVEISLTHLEANKTTYSGEMQLVAGKHKIDLNLSGLSDGNYVLAVHASHTFRELEFSV